MSTTTSTGDIHGLASATDTALAQLWEEAFDLQRTLGWKQDRVRAALGQRRPRDPRTWRDLPWEVSLADTVAEATALAATAPASYPSAYDATVWTAIAARDALVELVAAEEAVRVNAEAQRPLDELFDEHLWSRFFLVQNTGGHIHRSMHCSTTFPTTRWAWLPQLSGLTEDVAVEQQGPRLCSVCFPSAPVEWTLGLPAKVDPNRCAGSGQLGLDPDRRYYTPRGRCPVCGDWYGISRSGGKLRPHKTPKA